MRGRKAPVGAVKTSKNGYHYTKTEERGWMLTHHLVVEDVIGRELQKGERVYFKDGDRTNISPDNLEVRRVKTKQDKIDELQNKIRRLQDELEDLKSTS